MALGHSPQIVRDGLVLYLDAANIKSYAGSGTTWTDLTKEQNNGTLVNGPTFDNGAIIFDGVNDKCNTNLLASDLGSTFTVMVFFDKRGVGALASAANRLVSADRSSGSTKWAIGLRNNGNIQFVTTGGSDNPINFPIPSDTPLFVAVTYNLTNYSMYINDELKADNLSLAIDPSSFSFIAIGGRTVLEDRFWDGAIYNIQIFNRVLTEAEIKQNFNALRGRYGI